MSEVWRKLVSNGWVRAVFRTSTIYSLRLNTWILTRFWLHFWMFKQASHTYTTELDHSVYVGLPNLYWTRVKCLGKINFNLHSKMALLTCQCHNNLPQLSSWRCQPPSPRLYSQLGPLEIKTNLVRHYVQTVLSGRGQDKRDKGYLHGHAWPICNQYL